MVDTESRKNGAGPNYARYIGVGFAFFIILGVFSVIGYAVDSLLGTLPLFLLLGLVLGFAGGLYHVYLALEKLGGG